MKRRGSGLAAHPIAAQRVVSALVALPIVLLMVWLGGWYLWIGCVCVLSLALYELDDLARRIKRHVVGWFSFIAGFLLLFVVQTLDVSRQLIAIGLIIVVLMVLAYAIFRRSIQGRMADGLYTIVSSLYISLPLACLLLLRSYGIWWALLALFATWSFDTGAYVCGRCFGTHKLAPAISPNKTWEGLCGGMACSIVVTMLCTVGPLSIDWYLAAFVGTVIGLAATGGDLAESAMKRRAGVKDSGSIMPGHGGLLDRIDGLLLSMVVVFIFAFFVRH